mgnify:CR=1 FL=1
MILPKNDGFTFWINPILKLTSVLVKIDGRILEKENKRVNTYLLNEFESFTGRRKMRLFTKYLQKEIAVNSIFEEINDSYENKEKIQVIMKIISIILFPFFDSLIEFIRFPLVFARGQRVCFR